MCSFHNLYPLLADIRQTASVTVRLRPCRTNFSSVVHQSVTEIASFLWRNQLPEFHLYFLWILNPVYQSNTVHQTDTMGIRYDCRLTKYISHDQVRALSPNTWQL